MKRGERKIVLRCAVYTRVSTDSGLEQDFNSLDNQREASEAYIKSQAHEGWKLIRERYDDGGFSGVRWSGRRSRSCWTMSGIVRSTSSSSTRLTGSRDRLPTLPSWSSCSTRTASPLSR